MDDIISILNAELSNYKEFLSASKYALKIAKSEELKTIAKESIKNNSLKIKKLKEAIKILSSNERETVRKHEQKQEFCSYGMPKTYICLNPLCGCTYCPERDAK